MSNEPDEPQDDAFTRQDETRRSLIRRAVAMSLVTAIALPAAWSYDHRRDGGEQQLASPPSTAAAPVASVPSETVAAPPPPATTITAAAVTDLPEIETAEDLARVTGRPLSEASDEDLPEITAPSPSSRSQDEDDDDTTSDDESPAVTTASASDDAAASPTSPPPADVRSGSAPDPDPAPTAAAPVAPPPSPPPDTTPAHTAAPASRDEQVQQLIRNTFPSDQHEMALKVAERESGFDPGAVSPSGCCLGIFQVHYTANQSLVNGLAYDRDDLFDPAANVAVAYALWQRSGWRPWSQTAY